ncbi:MAG: MFS transporter [Saccharolobus sp.]
MNRGKYIIIGFIIMCFNSLYQYSWNALEPLIRMGFNVSLVQIALGFTLFSIFSSGFQPIGGHFADKTGPKIIGLISALLSALGFLGTYFSPNIYIFYIFWSLGSIGEGILYGIAANLAIKWFKDKMGFATGLVSMGFGLGSAIANPFISMANNYKTVTLSIGLTEVILLPILLWMSDYPPKLSGEAPKQVILSAKFWLIYISFVGSVTPLTVMSSELPILGKNLPQHEIIILISILPLLSGISRPFLGYIADKLGILRTTLLLNIIMLIGSGLLLLSQIPISTVLIGFSGGSLITLYFNVSGEIFGTRFSTVNSGILYTGKALGGALGSSVFALLYTISFQLSIIYTIILSLVGVLSLLTLIVYPTKQIRKT